MATKNTRRNAVAAQNKQSIDLRGTKRMHEVSPNYKQAKRTRTAFGDITNRENVVIDTKRPTKKVVKENVVIDTKRPTKKAALKAGTKKKATTTIAVPKPQKESAKELTSSQQERDQSWELIELSQESNSSNASQNSTKSEIDVDALNDINTQLSQDLKPELKLDWEDIDSENMMDPFQVALYAADIFKYYRKREEKFVLSDYLPQQEDLSTSMRAILVDWLVEVQENFELNHETLYLAVKMVDHYLSRITVKKNKLQLVGATAMFIAGKFDERYPPVLDDFLYVCDDAYTRKQLIDMEMHMLRSLDFDLGIPLSYRYLRRFAKCGRADIETLTLGRYILEMSLMDYQLSRTSDCQLAAAALLLAKSMKAITPAWSDTLTHYTSHSEESLRPLMQKLNQMIAAAPSKSLATIRTKYSHKVFHEVAKISPLPVSE